MSFRSLGLGLVVAAAMAGCSGESSESSVAAVFPPNSAPIPSPVARIMVAKLYLGSFTGNSTIIIQGLDGTQLATAQTNSAGVAFFHNFTVPSDFRALARPQGSNVEFAAELRGFDQTNRQAVINVPTTLVSRYLKAHPGVSLTEAETRIRRALLVPENLMLDIGVGEATNGFFSHIDFFRKASAQGGFEAFMSRVLDRAGSEAFTLEATDLDGPITGLGDARLDAIANTARQKMRAQIRPRPDSVARVSSKGELTAQDDGGLAANLLLGVGTGIGGNLITAGANAVVGWAANQMGLNYGTQGQLEQIQKTLNGVSNQVNDIQKEISTANVVAAVQTADAQVVNITSATTQLVRQITNTSAITNQPFTPSPTLSSLVGYLTNTSWSQTSTNLNAALVSTSGALLGVQSLTINDQLGLDNPSRVQYYPMRTNHVLYSLLQLYSYYSQQQCLMLNLWSESIHNYSIVGNPVAAIFNNVAGIASAVGNLKTQRQMQGLLTSQWAPIIDYENAIMWCENMGAPTTYDEAVSDVSSVSYQLILPDGSSVVYDDWRLPNYGEYVSLQQRGTYNPTSIAAATGPSPVPVNSHNSYPDPGQSTAGLPSLGFQNVAQYLNEAPNGNGGNGDLWMNWVGASANGNVWEVSYGTQYEFRLNHSGSSDNTSLENDTNDTNCYVYCRTFGPNSLVYPYASKSGSNDSPLPSPSPFAGAAFTPGETAQYGIATSISGLTVGPFVAPTPSPSPFPIPNGVLQLDANISYQVNVGGAFTLGNATNLRVTNPSYAYSGTVSTKPQNGAPAILRQLVRWGTDSFLSSAGGTAVSNLPGLDGMVLSTSTTPVTLTASLATGSADPNGTLTTVSGSLTYSPAAAAPHNLLSIQITPRNQIFGVPIPVSVDLYCTGFYSDGTVASLGGVANWTVSPANNPAGATIQMVGSQPQLQMPSPSPYPSPYNLTITATANGTTDSTQFQIAP